MESNKVLPSDQLNKLKETVRQRFDELYHRIGSNRQNLMNKVLFVHHQINKDLAKENIGEDQEKEILRKVREIERAADSQLPLFHKTTPAQPSVPKPESLTPPAKASKESKPVKETKAEKPVKPEKATKPAKKAKSAKASKPTKTTTSKTKKKKK